MSIRHPLPAALLAALALAACRSEPAPTGIAPVDPPAPTADATVEARVAKDGLIPRAFLCRGNEPFWTLELHASGGLLKTPESELPLAGELRAGASGSFAFRGSAEEGDGSAVEALLAPGQCLDTMADGPAMPFSAQVAFGDGQAGSGCCSAEFGLDLSSVPVLDAVAKTPEDWSRWLPELEMAMQRCIGDAGVATEAVSVAWPMNRGRAGVRLRDSAGDRFDCIVDLGSRRIQSVDAVVGDDRLPGEAQPVWLPAGDTPPILACGRAERTLAADGSVTGYLHYAEDCD